MSEELYNYIDGQWQRSAAADYVDVTNPATDEVLARAPLSPAAEVDRAAQAAQRAFEAWRRVPVVERVQYLYKLKALLEEHVDELARLITQECGKTFRESVGELRRGIENVEVACGTPSLIQGYNNEDIARGIDEHMFRQPVGVVAAITPFNFPGMIPLWFLPYAIACGNCFILKPSEKTPLTARRLFELLDDLGLPPGVVQLVNGARETVEAILDHPAIRAISFVGSTPVAKAIYRRAADRGKRVQAQGGAKNPVIIMPDADMEMAVRVVAESAYGCAGQRCLALADAITVGDAHDLFLEMMADRAAGLKVGYGLDEGVEMGPVITRESKARVEGLIALAEQEGARVVVDGRGKRVPGYEGGYFVFPTLLDRVPPESQVERTEIFGPVLSVFHVRDMEEAIRLVNSRQYGNMASIFTTSGAHARRFRYEANAGNIGINIGVAAPMAFYPFSGWNESFFGDLHAQGRHAIEFYTQTKVVVERWG